MNAKFNKKSALTFLRAENSKITDLLTTFNVPDSIEDDDEDLYLLPTSERISKNRKYDQNGDTSLEDIQERLNTIKNKMKSKKRPVSERALKKREAKKLKKNKQFKKVLISAAKSIKNESKKLKTEDSKKDVKSVVPKPVFNEEGKMVFSKFDFASHPGAKVKKSHQNPREILKKIKETDKKINELKEQGEIDKAAELKTDIAWKKAFEKIEGKKVKDDPKLLYKAIKKRKLEKKKAKVQWMERRKKVEAEIAQRQKKRQENIDKRIKDTQNRKLKHLSKRGKVIAGF